ncbi:YceI family protein [Acidisoma silvae]|uniref:YceI family protein n=1 Tax=Acidisoma silvae TaxID=2802396 RepID=A0A963YRR8_9PROT|nr:YceI family protein [Acidisoma silvae]MCB8875767.1 YceI family protein [Acidisoma silvae]
MAFIKTGRDPFRRKSWLMALCLAAGIGLASRPAVAHPVEYVIDQTTARIAFGTTVANVVPVNGDFRHFTAHIHFDTDHPSAVNIAVLVFDDAINVPFGGAATLRSRPYFDAMRFPTIRFESDSVQALPGDRFAIAGNLTIRDVSRPQALTGTLVHSVAKGVPVMRLVFHSRLNRTDFGMVADRPLIADDVTLTITTVLRAP